MVTDELDNPRWLGFELHDGLLQWVVGARMQLEVAVASTEDPVLRKRLKQIMRYVELAIEEGRGLIGFIEDQNTETPHDLSATIDQFVLALQPLAQSRNQTIVFQHPQRAWPVLSQPRLWNVIRIAQQAIRNAIAHAGPADIRITTDWQDEQQMRLRVADSGVGFSQDTLAQPSASRNHFGISSMRHRAMLIGGQLEITSAPGQGTTVQLTLRPE